MKFKPGDLIHCKFNPREIILITGLEECEDDWRGDRYTTNVLTGPDAGPGWIITDWADEDFKLVSTEDKALYL